MNTMNRRIEIINILIIRRHTTANELAQELGVLFARYSTIFRLYLHSIRFTRSREKTEGFL